MAALLPWVACCQGAWPHHIDIIHGGRHRTKGRWSLGAGSILITGHGSCMPCACVFAMLVSNTHKYAAKFCVLHTIRMCVVRYIVKYAIFSAYLCVFRSLQMSGLVCVCGVCVLFVFEKERERERERERLCMHAFVYVFSAWTGSINSFQVAFVHKHENDF